MPLVDYEAARPWAKAIRDEVISRRMPPWGAVKGFGEFRDDPSLTQDEIARIAEWVEGGAPEGDARYLPPKASAALQEPSLPAGVRTRSTQLFRDSTLLGIRPLQDVPGSARVTAIRPDNSVEPLLWMLNFRAGSHRTFVYREPLRLPAGTKIASPVPVELLLKAPSRAR